MSSLGPVRRALLIASPFGRLQGPGNDVDLVADLLNQHSFHITRLYDTAATRNEILKAWNNLIDQTNSDDVVVIYYSGHGGLVEPSSTSAVKESEHPSKSRRHQFIVPIDFGSNAPGDFRGILDIEISALVYRTAQKTRNVTTIFDCCHSGRMSRDPRHEHAIPKGLPHVEHYDLTHHVDQLRERGEIDLQGHINLEGNQQAVRIAAAADSETAWEDVDGQGKYVGALTRALIPIVHEALSEAPMSTSVSDKTTEEELVPAVSWKNVMSRVRHLVNTEFPEQHPQSEGPHERILFSRKRIASASAFPVSDEEGEVFLMAGRVAGVVESNEYVLMPPSYHNVVEDKKLAVGKAKTPTGFRTVLRVPSGFRLPASGALAYLKTKAVYKWPIAFPAELRPFEGRVLESRFIQQQKKDDTGNALARIVKEGNNICLYNGNDSSVKCASFNIGSKDDIQDAVYDAVEQAEYLARANHIRALEAEREERLEHNLGITFRSASPQQDIPHQTVTMDGEGEIQVGHGAVITLHNKGEETVFVSVFDINVAGRIFHLSRSSPEGIRLPPGQEYTLGKAQYSENTPGLRMSWPKGVPVTDKIPESFLFAISSESVDLRDFAQSRRGTPRGDASQLEQLAYHLAYAQNRDCGSENTARKIKWDMYCLNFFLRQ